MSVIATTARRAWATHWSLRGGIIATLLFLLVGFASVVWTPYATEQVDVGAAMQDWSSAHWLGTDPLGRDIVSLLMKGTLTSFVVAAVAVAIGLVVGLPLGFAAAAWSGPLDWAIRKLADFLFVFPALVAAILIATLAGPSAIAAMVAIGVFNIAVFARVARGAALSVGGADYVGAARLAGLTGWEIARRHVLPNLAGVLVVYALLQLAVGILAEAGLAYIGLGTQPPATSLGLMLKDGQSYLLLKPMLAVVPGIVIVLVVVALNLAADGLRDLLDPRLKRIGAIRGAV